MTKQTNLKVFEQFMADRDLVPEAYRSFYVHWVRRFLNSEFNASELEGRDKVECFAGQLARDSSVKDWQHRQALQAVALYLDVYLPEAEGREHGAGGLEGRGSECAGRAMEDGRLRGAGGTPAVQGRQDAGQRESRSASTWSRDGTGSPASCGPEEALREMRKLLRLRHYAYRTEQTYVEWVERYLKYVARQELAWDDPASIRAWLSYLALQRKVASSTQNQALSAVLFLFQATLKIEVGEVNAVRAKRGPRLPVVLSVEEVRALLGKTEGTAGMMLRLIYGGGLRISDALRLRVQDLDFENELLFVRSGKGDKDRTTILPESLCLELRTHLAKVRELHERDLAKGFGTVHLPDALAHKYPNAPKEWKWQYVFPAKNLSIDPRSGQTRRHHVSDSLLQSAMKRAVATAEIHKHVTVHTLRHSFATHLLMSGTNIREVQELLGHKNVETTMLYTHVIRELGVKPQSPLDLL